MFSKSMAICDFFSGFSFFLLVLLDSLSLVDDIGG